MTITLPSTSQVWMVLMLRFWSRLEGLYQIRWSQVDLDLKEKECNVRKGFKGKIFS